jgi:hypothetical protein
VDRFLRAVTQRLLARGYGPPQEPDSTQGKTEVAPGVLGYSTLDVELSTQRVDIYEDMDEIDDTVPEGSRALDVLADNAVNAEGGGLTSFVVTYERKVPASQERLIEEMLSRVRMREKAYAIARDAAKYGDNFQQIIVSRSMRIERLMYMPPNTMRRNEDEHGLLKTGHEKGEWAFEQYEPNTTNLIAGFYPWQIEHLRWNRSGSSKYGRAQLYSARYAWKKWLAMQEALVVNWLTRAFVRLVFKLDTTGKKPAEAQEYLRGFMENLKRRTVASGMSGEEAMSVARDLAIGTGYISHNGQTVPMMTDVETLDTSNSGFWNVTAIEYWRNKFIAATGVPKAHLGLEQDVRARATLQWQDERFTRTVRRVQSMMSELIAHLIDLELLLHGVNPQTVPYKIEWANPSTMDQLERAQSLHYIGMAAERLLEWGIVDREWLRINALRQTPQQAQDLASRTQDRTPTEGEDE